MSPAEFQLKLNRWDDELTDYMRRSENKCHKFKQNHIEWSPEVGVWIHRRSLLNESLGFKLGKWKGFSNMFPKCKVNKIGDPPIMTIDVVRAKHLFVEKDRGTKSSSSIYAVQTLEIKTECCN